MKVSSFDILNIVYVENKGISFGMLSEYNIPFWLGILSFAISLYVIFLIVKSESKLELTGLSLILGGAIGNGIDRLFSGYVIDFIDLSENGLKFRMDQESDILTLPIHRVRTLTSRMGDVIYPKPIHLKR